MMSKLFPKLFESSDLGGIRLKNRIMKAPQHMGLANPDGSVTERMLQYYKSVALGGAGMVIVEYAWVDHDASQASPCQLGVADMQHIAGLSVLAKTIQGAGAKAGLQISHAGRQKFLCRPPIKSASRVPWEELYYFEGCPPPNELTFEEILEVVKAFGDAAKRTQMAGFDLVEFHACHGYLISNFLSPRTNKRTDWYGGSLENRMRFLLDVVKDTRAKVGPDYPISVRVSGTDYEPDGNTIEETITLCKELEALGVTVIHMSGGNHHTGIHEVAPMMMPAGNNVWAAEAVKKKIGIPVIASGSLTSPKLAEQVLVEGKADYVAFGRPLWADPEFPNKAKADKPEQIRPCIRCNDGCLVRGDRLARTVQCSVNASLAREDDFTLDKAVVPKKVAVIGGGPAGMEAARVLALRGHDVTLFEKRKLGGVLIEASTPDFKADLRPLISYFAAQMELLKVNVVSREATLQDIKTGGFEAVIAATGGHPIHLNIPGVDHPMVSNALKVLRGEVELGEHVIIVGGGMVGIETALAVADKCKQVTVVEMTDDAMANLTPDELTIYPERLKRDGAVIKTGKRLTAVSDKTITVCDRFGREEEMGCDNVVLAIGLRPDRKLIDDLEKEGSIDVHEVGDCVKPRKILDAIHEGFRVARWV
jgi:2,4-dienoyl-CoA reductase-like NADH-dependent reductase (Old Yellow Enzyme family)/thioredoxin reductase